MSLLISQHFSSTLEVRRTYAESDFAAVNIADGKERTPVGLYFYRLADIETLVAALQKLGNDFAAAQPAPTYTDATLADFGCSPDIIARAEADAEARDINRLTGRDPHQCVKCDAVDCVCVKG